MTRSDAVPSGEGWLESGDWLHRARRLGPLRYSDLGPRRLEPIDPEAVGPLARWLAGAADRWWDDAGRPDPYTLVVVSGDDGHLARAVLDWAPACGPALRYVLVDPQLAGRREPPAVMARLVGLEEPAFLYPAAPPAAAAIPPPPAGTAGAVPAGVRVPGDGVDSPPGTVEDDYDPGERPPARGIGPLATFLTEVPGLGDSDGAVVALGLLSRLAYDLFERGEGGWLEIRLAARGERLEEIGVPVEVVPEPSTPREGMDAGLRWRRLSGALDWMRSHLPTAEAGVLAVVDRWAGTGDTDSLDLQQFRHVREPLEPVPQTVAGTPLSVVTWRLG